MNIKAPKDLREWIEKVEQQNLLQRLTEQVDPNEEMTAITYMVANETPSPALLFENVKGYPDSRVLFNLIGSSKERLALTLGISSDVSEMEMIHAIREKLKERIPPIEVEQAKAPIYENTLVGEDIHVHNFPAPKHWPLDGGNYIGTADIVITRDPETGILNVGTYRQMVHNDKEVGVMFSPGKDGRQHMEKYFKQGKPMPIAAAWGIDPLMMVVGSMGAGRRDCEYDIAGGITGSPIEVTKGKVTDLLIPANAEIIIEGYVYPDNFKFEGPFGEFTGYYGRPGEDAPTISIEAIHFRNDPISTGALMADYPACEQEVFLAYMRSAKLLDEFDKLGIPGIKGVYSVPQAAAGFGMTVISIEQMYPGHVSQALSIAAQAPSSAYFAKWIIAVDDDVDPTNINDVVWAMATRSNPVDDIDILRNTWSTWLDPTQNPPEQRPYASKALINACKNHKHIKTFAKRTAIRQSIYNDIANRWGDLGLPGKPPKLNFYHEE
ncbi:UbiD family decarboxylase [Bacillus sp. Marseille-P3661]|uniref:UbiD family decarboxylase n=1 Tax=Bacillus sp. Marseille-P3661 TaxID=1936234 RepID=UPI0015E1A006|nr:UbiD family decarboxylase [Bacillus sp. Marseille-P3661]